MILPVLLFLAGFSLQPHSQIKISVAQEDGSGAAGAGVVVDKNTILTAYHVLANAKFVKATCGDKVLDTEGIAFSKQLDLALIKYKEDCDIKPIKVAEKDEPRGSDLYLVGYPGDYPLMITKGIVSGYSVDLEKLRPEMWSDVKTWFGNSGGPAINSKGELIGISSAMSAPFELSIEKSGVDLVTQQYSCLIPVSAIKVFLAASKPKPAEAPKK